ncbi:MAG TPA: hypothetical protein PLT77_11845 [Burkholderiaceae bacterium]|nr:hypothetical protein [Burkholderiaceae bacterium]
MAKIHQTQDPQTRDPVAQGPVARLVASGPDELDNRDPDWWSESTDGRCSETAALFAESQPAPLTIV